VLHTILVCNDRVADVCNFDSDFCVCHFRVPLFVVLFARHVRNSIVRSVVVNTTIPTKGKIFGSFSGSKNAVEQGGAAETASDAFAELEVNRAVRLTFDVMP
jgi:hypothetical protein